MNLYNKFSSKKQIPIYTPGYFRSFLQFSIYKKMYETSIPRETKKRNGPTLHVGIRKRYVHIRKRRLDKSANELFIFARRT